MADGPEQIAALLKELRERCTGLYQEYDRVWKTLPDHRDDTFFERQKGRIVELERVISQLEAALGPGSASPGRGEEQGETV